MLISLMIYFTVCRYAFSVNGYKSYTDNKKTVFQQQHNSAWSFVHRMCSKYDNMKYVASPITYHMTILRRRIAKLHNMCVETTKHCFINVNILFCCCQSIHVHDCHFKKMTAYPLAPILTLQQISFQWVSIHAFFTDSIVRSQFYRSNAKQYCVSIKLTEKMLRNCIFHLSAQFF